ncbi:MAG: Uma2 family endonuclease [Planctomycetota bacterium]|nr:Uma2 family endonuclease [Planctomycetota bacterium]
MSTHSHTADRVVMRDVPWETYLGLAAIGDRHTRIAYDQGVLEIMSPMKVHERVGYLIGRMVETWTEIKKIDVVSVASTTFQLDKASRGFQADEGYCIKHEEFGRNLDEVDVATHRGPDLVIEVDLTNSAMSKFGIYSSLEVAEVWQWQGEELAVYAQTGPRSNRHGYRTIPESLILPRFPILEVVRLVRRRLEERENTLIREFGSIAIGTSIS